MQSAAVEALVTIDHERGVYVVRSKNRIQTAPYSSRETAARVAEFYRWRGWEVRIVGETQSNGDSKVTTDKARQIEESLVKTLWRIDAFGTEKADGRSLRGLRKRGLIDERGGITAAGRELMAGYSQFALQTPDEWLSEPQEEELSEVKVTKVLPTVTNEAHHQPNIVDVITRQAADLLIIWLEQRIAPVLARLESVELIGSDEAWETEADPRRVLLHESRWQMLQVVEKALPDELKPLVNTIHQINDLLEG